MKSRSSRSCKEAGDALTLGTGDDLGQRRAELHLEHCEDCQEAEQVMAGLERSVLSANDSLDDLTRARVQSRLAEAMEQAATAGAAAPLWRRPVARLAAAAVCLVAVGATLWWATNGPAPASSTRQAAVATSTGRELLLPRALVKGSTPWAGSAKLMGRSSSRLTLPAGVALRVDLSRNAELTLYGPLDLSVAEVSGDRVELRLRRGILVGVYDARKGGTLVIRSPDAVTEVVGTLFAVEAHDGQSRVSVSRGRVKVKGAGTPVMVGPQKSWSTRAPSLVDTPPSVAALFIRHDQEPRAAVDTVKTGADSHEAAGSALAVRSSSTAPAAAPRPGPRQAPPRVPDRRPAKKLALKPAPGPQPTPPPPAAEVEQAPAVAPAKKSPATTSGPSVSQLYKQAEAALARRDGRQAERLLSRIVRAHPADPRTDSARYDLALLLLKRGQRKEAEAALAGIGKANGRSRFLGPAHYLRCRLRRESADLRGAVACYAAFKDAFPASPHHRQALRLLIRLLVKEKSCTRAGGVIADYLAQYPADAFAKKARRLRKGCGR